MNAVVWLGILCIVSGPRGVVHEKPPKTNRLEVMVARDKS